MYGYGKEGWMNGWKVGWKGGREGKVDQGLRECSASHLVQCPASTTVE